MGAGVETCEKAPLTALVWSISELTRDETADPHMQDQIQRYQWGQRKVYLTFSLTTSRIDGYML